MLCSKCGKNKPKSEFRPNPTQSRGFCYYCRSCERKYALRYYHTKIKPKQPKKAKIRKKIEKKSKRPQKKQEKIKVFKVFSRQLCSNFEEPHKTVCLTTIHKLAKQLNDEGKLKIRMVHGFVCYAFSNKEVYEQFLERVQGIKRLFA